MARLDVRLTVNGQEPRTFFRDQRGRFASRASAVMVTGHVPTEEERQSYIEAYVWGGVTAEPVRHVEYIVGSDLPYASHWIEEGWRNDPRYGRVNILYRTPGYARFMDAAALAVNSYVTADFAQYPPPIGVLLDAYAAGLAQIAIDTMHDVLQREVYSVPPIRRETRQVVIVNRRTGRRRVTTRTRIRTWQRTHALYNSIKMHRIA